MELKLESRALKVTAVLDPAALAGIEIPNGTSKVTLRIAVGGRTVTAEVNAKSLRRAVTAINAAGPENVAVIIQGKLEANNVLAEAGIAAQPKAQKVAVAA
jgi:hypothetical protein